MFSYILVIVGITLVLAGIMVYDWVVDNRTAIMHEAEKQRIRAAVAQGRKERMAPLDKRVRVSIARLKLSQKRIAATEAVVGKIED